MLTLTDTWDKCLEMWEWIVAKWLKDPTQSVGGLKVEWMDANGLTGQVRNDCFFCQFGDETLNEFNSHLDCICEVCPARLVNRNFSCTNITYDYQDRPGKFLAKIKELRAIDLKQDKP